MDQDSRRKRRKSLPMAPKREDALEEGTAEGPARKRPRGRLRRRWLVNTLAVTLVVVAIAVSAFSLAMYSYYTSTTARGKAHHRGADFELRRAGADVVHDGYLGRQRPQPRRGGRHQ